MYVYYRIDAADFDAVCSAVQVMQAELRHAHPGLDAALLRRPVSEQGQLTLMETYAAPQGVDAALQARIEAAASALSRWLRGARHSEVFEPIG
nr:DUF4936 family protein [Aquabacterium terrae]